MASDGRAANGQFGPGNIGYYGRVGYGVGLDSFLESEGSRVAAYWRGIEKGSDRFVGRVIYGLFGDRAGPRGGLINGILTPFGEGQGQKFVPFSTPETDPIGGRRAGRYLRGEQEQGGSTRGVIKKAIKAQEAYVRAREEFDNAAAEKKAILDAFRATSSEGFLSERTRQRRTAAGRNFASRTGLKVTFNLSGFDTSILLFDQQFASELQEANKALAFALASKVAEIQHESLLRPDVSSGRLEAATLSPDNRFPT